MGSPPAGMFARRSAVLDRWVRIGVASGKVIRVDFPTADPGLADTDDHPVLARLIGYLDDGERDEFGDVEIGLTVPTNHRRIYATVREIPYGTQWDVREVTERTAIVDADEDGVRTSREALTANPVPVLVPDHRVVDISGSVDTPVRTALREREGLE